MNKIQLDEQFMLQALAISKQALPACLPNPPIGCVLVSANQVVASGYTHAPGFAHAEADALANYLATTDIAAQDFPELSAYVTLEPCSFYGRTPSCALTLIEHHIKRVVVALVDPDPRNNGTGISLLTNAGIEVDIGICESQVASFLNPFLSAIEEK
ncbi:MAG: bifunctional diaminohydroxyphosphoribosylaminopyrimidine deaminase/5-amino-6-(5-phosphoribosylamino)uracil reductase RibD [Oceanospirillaceae bacterium]